MTTNNNLIFNPAYWLLVSHASGRARRRLPDQPAGQHQGVGDGLLGPRAVGSFPDQAPSWVGDYMRYGTGAERGECRRGGEPGLARSSGCTQPGASARVVSSSGSTPAGGSSLRGSADCRPRSASESSPRQGLSGRRPWRRARPRQSPSDQSQPDADSERQIASSSCGGTATRSARVTAAGVHDVLSIECRTLSTLRFSHGSHVIAALQSIVGRNECRK